MYQSGSSRPRLITSLGSKGGEEDVGDAASGVVCGGELRGPPEAVGRDESVCGKPLVNVRSNLDLGRFT
jgi:hypothetical protein